MTSMSACCGGDDTGRALVAGTLRGYRSWLPVRRKGLASGALPLASVQIPGVVWTKTLHARCFAPAFSDTTQTSEPSAPHGPPERGCRCGIYAWYRPDDSVMMHAPVFGVIAASGVIMMGTRGFRAQQADIVAVVTHKRGIAAACEQAGVAVYRRRRHLLHDFPTEDLTVLLDDSPTGEPACPDP